MAANCRPGGAKPRPQRQVGEVRALPQPWHVHVDAVPPVCEVRVQAATETPHSPSQTEKLILPSPRQPARFDFKMFSGPAAALGFPSPEEFLFQIGWRRVRGAGSGDPRTRRRRRAEKRHPSLGSAAAEQSWKAERSKRQLPAPAEGRRGCLISGNSNDERRAATRRRRVATASVGGGGGLNDVNDPATNGSDAAESSCAPPGRRRPAIPRSAGIPT